MNPGAVQDQDGYHYGADLVTLAQNEGMDDTTAPDLDAAATRKVRVRLDDLRQWTRELDDARRKADDLETARDNAVRFALDAGATAIEAAEAAGLTKWRVYQIRDRRR